MFSEGDRSRLLAELVDRARRDPQIAAAAVVGSAAGGVTDRWSDIDLALGLGLGLSDSASLEMVADRWATELAVARGVADALDVWAGPVLYRVFLLEDSLQVDVSFWPAGSLAPNGAEPFLTVFGDIAPASTPAPSDPREALRWGWLYALHVRSAIARGRLWQATQMLEGMRSQVIVLSCLRHGLETHHGRGVDALPDGVLDQLVGALPRRLSGSALTSAYTSALECLAGEAQHVDRGLADRLALPFANLRESAAASVS